MTVLYIAYIDLNDIASGSGVRPYCMYRAFQERGYELHLLSGVCGRGFGAARRAAVRETVNWLRNNRPDFCYIESSTYPILNQCDYSLIRLLHRKKIPTAYFYRDFYRKFPNLFPRRSGFRNRLKESYLDFLTWKTDRVLRLVDIVYFPSEACTKLFHYQRMNALPPAGDIRFLPLHPNRKTCIYVGGISERYGIHLLIQTFMLLNQGEKDNYHLILVCRESEYAHAAGIIGQHPWLEVYHKSGSELEPLYAQADIGLFLQKPNQYANLAVGIKIFQYLSYGLPVIATEADSINGLIRENGFGETVPYDPKAFAAAIERMLNEPGALESCRETAKKSFIQKHLWVHRVDQIAENLTGAKLV